MNHFASIRFCIVSIRHTDHNHHYMLIVEFYRPLQLFALLHHCIATIYVFRHGCAYNRCKFHFQGYKYSYKDFQP